MSSCRWHPATGNASSPPMMRCSLLLLLTTLGALWGEDAWVNSLYAKVRSATSFPAKTVATLERGDRVSVTERSERWITVTLSDGRSGFISSRHLVASEPSEESLWAALGRTSRAESGDVSGTAGGRGIGPIAKKYAQSKNATTAIADVEQLEQLPYNVDELETFMAEGGLGDYQD